MSQDRAIALQPGQQEQSSISKKKNKTKQKGKTTTTKNPTIKYHFTPTRLAII